MSDESLRALRLRAARNGRSLKAEVRAILDGAVFPEARLKVGSELAAFGDKFEWDVEFLREKAPGCVVDL